MLSRSFREGKILTRTTVSFSGSRTWLWFPMRILQHDQSLLLFGIYRLNWRHAHLLFIYWASRQKDLIGHFSCYHASRAYPNVLRRDFQFNSADNSRHAADLLWMLEWVSVCILFQYISGGRRMENQLHKLVKRSLRTRNGNRRCSILLHQIMDDCLYLCFYCSSNHHFDCCDTGHLKNTNGYVCLIIWGLHPLKTKEDCQYK